MIRNSKVLVIGGAGTIGSAVTLEIFKRNPNKLHVVDINENTMVELVRDIRSSYGYIKGETNYVIKIASGYWKNHELGIPNGNGMMLLLNQKIVQPLAILIDHGI